MHGRPGDKREEPSPPAEMDRGAARRNSPTEIDHPKYEFQADKCGFGSGKPAVMGPGGDL